MFEGELCPICRKVEENVEHLFLQCQGLRGVRENAESWLETILNEQTRLDRDMVVLCRGLDSDLLAFFLSVYKMEVWMMRNLKKFENQEINEIKFMRRIEEKLRFYIRYLYRENDN